MRINLLSKKSIKKSSSPTNPAFANSISHNDNLALQKAEPSVNLTLRGTELTEAVTMTAHRIQFASSAMAMEVKLMQVICMIENTRAKSFNTTWNHN
jgi:hypothetical protein